jgi:hypothetical protein
VGLKLIFQFANIRANQQKSYGKTFSRNLVWGFPVALKKKVEAFCSTIRTIQ